MLYCLGIFCFPEFTNNMDARLEAIEETLQRVTQILATAGLGNTDRPIQNMNNNVQRNQEDRTIRIDLQEFDGKSDNPEV